MGMRGCQWFPSHGIFSWKDAIFHGTLQNSSKFVIVFHVPFGAGFETADIALSMNYQEDLSLPNTEASKNDANQILFTSIYTITV